MSWMLPHDGSVDPSEGARADGRCQVRPGLALHAIPGRAGAEYRAGVDEGDLMKRAKSFENGAADYERWRPEFPTQLFDDIRAAAGSRMSGRVLEVGAGTGRATLPWYGAEPSSRSSSRPKTCSESSPSASKQRR